jgi:hypothetical protein
MMITPFGQTETTPDRFLLFIAFTWFEWENSIKTATIKGVNFSAK